MIYLSSSKMRFPCFIKLSSMAMAMAMAIFSLLLLYSCSFFSAIFTFLALLLSIFFQHLQKIRQAHESSYKFKKLGEVLDEMKPDEGAKLGVLAESDQDHGMRERESRTNPAVLVKPLQDSPRPSASGSSNCLTSDEETSPDDDQDVCRSTECSETSLSDDENLFEIDLPGGGFITKKSTDLIRKQLPLMSDHLKISELRQLGLKEILSEINEEDNLIEIDIARGSIKF